VGYLESMRIAFVTPRFPTEDNSGLSSYLNRITRSLCEEGHEVEVFVRSVHTPGTIDFDGMKVHRVGIGSRSLWYRVLRKIAAIISMDSAWMILVQSWRLCRALESREKEAHFEAVQYSDCLAVGLCMRKRPDRRSIVRASTAIALYHQADGTIGIRYRIWEWLELLSIRRADKRYAPSRFISSFFRDVYGIEMDVIRPACRERYSNALHPYPGLPTRYFINFGQLCRRKGTYWLIDALRLAFARDPSIQVIMVGQDNRQDINQQLSILGEHRANVHLFPPLPQAEVFRILAGARAAIVPSLVDNLPNSVIESLQHGIPVIGSRGASIDEMVEVGVTGELAEIGDSRELSELILKFWHNESHIRPGFTWNGLPGESEGNSKLITFFQTQPNTRTVGYSPSLKQNRSNLKSF
jgi:glycosyltransferase involved in cell wall biosynthesis